MGAIGACCKWSAFAVVVFLSFLCAPLLDTLPRTLALDDMQAWGLKGPFLDELPPNMVGMYYLNAHGAKCTGADKRNRTICHDGWKRSPLVLLDSSYMSYDRKAGM